MSDYKLSYHGQTKEVCEWVIVAYEHRTDMHDNKGVQEWISESKRWLEDHGYNLP